MRQKKEVSFLYPSRKTAAISVLIFSCLILTSFAQENESSSSEKDAIPSVIPNSDANVENIKKPANAVSDRQADKDLVSFTEGYVTEFVVYKNQTHNGEILAEIKTGNEKYKALEEVDEFEMDPIFNEIIEPNLRFTKGKNEAEVSHPYGYSLVGNQNTTFLKSKDPYLYNTFEGFEEFERGKRGALHLAAIIKCATNCNPLLFKGYGCYCGFMGAGTPVDGIDTCCKMHDWCYSTSDCHGLEWDLPYFVPFKWKCNGGAPYCIPGRTKRTWRNSCSHQLCECDREFAMCLHKYLPCPRSKAACKNKKRLWQNLLMGFTSGHGMHHPHKSGAVYYPHKPTRHQHRGHHSSHRKPKTFNPFNIFG
jgi:secretory phospholipase A2